MKGLGNVFLAGLLTALLAGCAENNEVEPQATPPSPTQDATDYQAPDTRQVAPTAPSGPTTPGPGATGPGAPSTGQATPPGAAAPTPGETPAVQEEPVQQVPQELQQGAGGQQGSP